MWNEMKPAKIPKIIDFPKIANTMNANAIIPKNKRNGFEGLIVINSR
jgi:hypothetical protein